MAQPQALPRFDGFAVPPPGLPRRLSGRTLAWTGSAVLHALAGLALLIGMPLYVVLAVSLVGLFDRPGVAVEFAIYVALGVVWILPLRAVFRGVGRDDPDARP